jgi:hypothetical protein
MHQKQHAEKELTVLMALVTIGGLVLSSITITYAVQLTRNDSGSTTHALRSWVAF